MNSHSNPLTGPRMKAKSHSWMATTLDLRTVPATRWALVPLILGALLLSLPPHSHAQSADPQEYTFLTLAGPAEGGPGAIDGLGTAAWFSGPTGVAVDGGGNVYVADSGNHTIRKVSPTGAVTTLAGMAGKPGTADGTGGMARFFYPCGVAADRAGNLYVVDSGAGNVRIGNPETCPDRPVVDLVLGPVGVTRQLDTSPHTATAWQWKLIRRPAGSTAELIPATIRNPTFTPDVADLFVFRLLGTNKLTGAVSIRTLELSAVSADVAVLSSPQRLADGPFQLSLIGQTNQSYTLQVSTNLTTWTDWINATPASFTTPLTDAEAPRHAQRFYRARTH